MKFSVKDEIRSDDISMIERAMKSVDADAKVNVDIGTKTVSVDSWLMPEEFLVAFADQSRVDHAAERAVERAGPHFHFSLRIGLDLLHDPVAVPLLIREREQDMKHRGGEGRVGLVGCHTPSVYPLRIDVKRI